MLLLACGGAGLRPSALSDKLFYSLGINVSKEVSGVAFDAQTDTLLLLVEDTRAKGLVDWHLVSLRERVHKASEWFEVQSLSINTSAPPGAETFHMAEAVCDATHVCCSESTQMTSVRVQRED